MSKSVQLVLVLLPVFGFFLVQELLGPPHVLGSEQQLAPISQLHQRSFGNPIPQTGDQKLLILLVDFPDRAGIFTGTSWQQKFFGPGGFADYFKEVSYQQLRYTGDVVGIANGSIQVNPPSLAYIRLPNPLTYYADGQYGFNVSPGQFPQNNGGGCLACVARARCSRI